jgi:hypothetical protein
VGRLKRQLSPWEIKRIVVEYECAVPIRVIAKDYKTSDVVIIRLITTLGKQRRKRGRVKGAESLALRFWPQHAEWINKGKSNGKA